MNRIFISLLFVFSVGQVTAISYAAELGEDGLHKQDWFTLSFKDISEDIEEAASQGKRLVLIFEARGCRFCAKLHRTHFADPDIVSYLKEQFQIIQYNLFGDEEVTDIDGEVLSEKSAAEKWGIKYTPYMLFMPEKILSDLSTELSAGSAAVAIIPGLYERSKFLHMFQWVKEKGYQSDESFQAYHARRLSE